MGQKYRYRSMGWVVWFILTPCCVVGVRLGRDDEGERMPSSETRVFIPEPLTEECDKDRKCAEAHPEAIYCKEDNGWELPPLVYTLPVATRVRLVECQNITSFFFWKEYVLTNKEDLLNSFPWGYFTITMWDCYMLQYIILTEQDD